jgi:hypothetical protein
MAAKSAQAHALFSLSSGLLEEKMKAWLFSIGAGIALFAMTVPQGSRLVCDTVGIQ